MRILTSAIALLLAASGVQAQDALPQQPPQLPPPVAAPAPDQAPVAAAGSANLSREKMQRIYHIRQLEGMFTNAVRTGAASLANQLKVGEPNSLFVTGNARTRGFELEGYGIFFDVDVPTMMQSVLWSSQQLQQREYLDFLQRRLADPTLDENTRRMADFELRRVSRAMANGQVVPIPAVPPVGPLPQQPAQGIAVAQNTDVPAASSAPPPDPRNANELYTETIQGALIDAMLSYGSALRLADNEWLTIAARASSPSASGGLDDSSSIVLRIKGSDLAAFLSGKITREDAIKRIETKES